jgi:hypothetical protein
VFGQLDQLAGRNAVLFIGVMRMMTGRSSRKRIEGAVAQANAKLPVKETFRLFGAAPNGDE